MAFSRLSCLGSFGGGPVSGLVQSIPRSLLEFQSVRQENSERPMCPVLAAARCYSMSGTWPSQWLHGENLCWGSAAVPDLKACGVQQAVWVDISCCDKEIAMQTRRPLVS